jgi:hypothetical protein
MDRRAWRKVIRDLLIELAVYGILVVVYSFVASWLIEMPLARLFHSNLTTYAFIGLGLIVAQGLLLDAITSFMIYRLRLDRLE